MNRLVRGILVVVGLTGCSGSQLAWREPDNAPAIEREVSTWFDGWQARLAAGQQPEWASAFRPDGLLLAPRSLDALLGPTAAGGGGMAPLTPEAELEVGLGGRGRAAWVAAAGAELRETALLERDGASWRVVMAHASLPVVEDQARAREEGDIFPRAKQLEEGVPEEALRLAEITSTCLGGLDAFTAAISQRPGIVAFGPAPTERFHGTHEVTEWIRALYARPGVRVVRDGGLRGGLAGAGDLGWIATNVDIVTMRGGKDLARPSRLTMIFAREGEDWRIVQIHLSHVAAKE